MKRDIAWTRVAAFAVGLAPTALLLAIGPLPSEASESAVKVLATVLSILTGFLIAIITMLGDPRNLLAGNWRVGSVHRREIKRALNRFSALFYLYLAAIGMAFVASLVDGSIPCSVHRWIEHIALSVGAGALALSFGLPMAVRREQMRRLDEAVEDRREG